MDVDTIFSAVSADEQILEKYQDLSFCGRFQLVLIITNLRLLIGRTFTACGYFNYSNYSSIHLHSIHRIDNISSHRRWIYIIFYVGLGLLLIGLTVDIVPTFIMIIGIVLMSVSVIGLFALFVSNPHRYIYIQGTFGATFLKFSEDIAGKIDARLNELIYQQKTTDSTHPTSTQTLYPNFQ